MDESIEYRITEIERRLSNLMRIGTVDQLNESSARVRVKSGGMLTGWLPWFTRRAGEDRDWWAPEPGEQVMILSPDGDPAQGIVLPAIYRDAYQTPAMKKTKRRIEFADGGYAEYDRSAGALNVLTKGPVNLTAKGSVNLISDSKVTVTGKATVEIFGTAGGTVKGIVQGDCLCCFTGQPHPMVSRNVKGSI